MGQFLCQTMDGIRERNGSAIKSLRLQKTAPGNLVRKISFIGEQPLQTDPECDKSSPAIS
jgi:hypothetical protein